MRWVSTERVLADDDMSATEGRIVWAPAKSLWYFAHAGLGLAGVVLYPRWDAALVFLALSGVTLCAGHSVGMHRLLIHRSFVAPIWVEHILVWLGTLVGMTGPFGMIRTHDMRDWHQRQTVCPPHPSHGAGFWRDAWWQLHCEFRLARPPRFEIEPRVANDRFYRFLERSWMLQQLPVAAALWGLGGWAWVLWGISLRIFVSLSGHWLVGHFAHRTGAQGWRIEGLPVQGYNLPGLGLLTFGENWHGNHHAFPHSAQMGVEPGQADPGHVLIRVMESLKLARDVKGPASEPPREGLVRLPQFPLEVVCTSVPPTQRPVITSPEA
jgi:stearoyl-CoA desaturase (delta-9 desaturase)